jgi:hypothetical protein
LCPAGSYCTTTTVTACNAGQFSGPGALSCYACPAGTTCSGGLIRSGATVTTCAQGSKSSGGTQASCDAAADGSYITEPDASGETACPAGFYTTSTGAAICTPSPITSKAPNTGTTSTGLTTCTAHTEFGTIGGTDCTTCNGYEPCSLEQQGKNTTCKPGFHYDSTTNTCLESATQSTYTGFTYTIDSRENNCPQGFMRGGTEDVAY